MINPADAMTNNEYPEQSPPFELLVYARHRLISPIIMRMSTLSGEATLLFLFNFPFQSGSILKENKLLP